MLIFQSKKNFCVSEAKQYCPTLVLWEYSRSIPMVETREITLTEENWQNIDELFARIPDNDFLRFLVSRQVRNFVLNRSWDVSPPSLVWLITDMMWPTVKHFLTYILIQFLHAAVQEGLIDRQSVFGTWPFWYTWIGYHRPMVRLQPFLSSNENHPMGVNIVSSKIAGSLSDCPVYQSIEFDYSKIPQYRNLN